MSKAVEAQMTGHGSHSVGLGRDIDQTEMSGTDREEVFPTFATEWRGAPVVVQMSADRYRYSGAGVSEWRIYVANAIEGTDPYGRGKALTPTAKSRLRDQLEPLVVEWLGSDEYRASRRSAVVRALSRELAERTYCDPPSQRAREHAARLCADQMSTAQWTAFAAACEAKDAAAAALEAFTSAE